MDRLETVYFRSDQTDEEAAELATVDNIAAVLNRKPRQPIYIVTRLKIAKNLRLTGGDDSKLAAEAGSSTKHIAGGDVPALRHSNIADSFYMNRDVIIAYQLHIIEKKGQWNKKIEADISEPRVVFWPRTQ